MFGGAITAILLDIPGAPENAPTAFDGYPMTRKGRAGKAVGAAVPIGFFCGILPGIGATLAAFMGYNEAVRWARDRSRFGRGALEGVVSSETANDAATGAAMIPLLALGLPGGGSAELRADAGCTGARQSS